MPHSMTRRRALARDIGAANAGRQGTGRMTRTLHVFSPLAWIGEVFGEELETEPDTGAPNRACVSNDTDTTGGDGRHTPTATSEAIDRRPRAHGGSRDWRVVVHHTWNLAGDNALTGGDANGDGDGPSAAGRIGEHDALWIAPDLIVRCNAVRMRNGLAPWRFMAPARQWMANLPTELSGRSIVVTQVDELRCWRRFPGALGERPWSQLCDGRVSGFNAARRDITELHHALSAAPGDSTIMVSGHLAGISEEWNVTMRRGRAVASCGYCLHLPPDSHRIVTVFDESAKALFHARYRARAEHLAERAAAAAGPISASLLIAFRTPSDPGAILEAEPVWCATPYPVGAHDMAAVIDTIAETRIIGGTALAARKAAGAADDAVDHGAEHEFRADPWMARRWAVEPWATGHHQ